MNPFFKIHQVYINWNTHDGMTLHLDPYHLPSNEAITQYSEYAKKRFIFGREGSWDHVEMKMMQTPTGRNYEWAIKLERELKAGISLALDLVVIDMDEDKSFSWLAWGDFTQKNISPNRCGDLVLLDDQTVPIKAIGSVDMTQLRSGPTTIPVRFTNIHQKDMWFQTRTDSVGHYQIELPIGQYQINIPQETQRIGNEFYQLTDHTPIQFEVNKTTNEILKLIPTQLLPPKYSVDQGVLFEEIEDVKKKVDQFVLAYQKYYEIPGVSLALIKNGKLAYHKTYGVTSTRSSEPVNENTLFEAASITKPVFGFLVLRMAEKELIDLDRPLFEYLPFEDLEVTPEYKKMTARHVLTHQSGLPNWGVPLIHSPGIKYGYSGEAFRILKKSGL